MNTFSDISSLPVAAAANVRPSPSGGGAPVLRATDLVTGYGDIQALYCVDLTVGEGEIVALVGANGAGKTTLLRTVSGLLPVWSGSIEFGDRSISRMRAAKRARQGIAHVPEGRQVFAPLTVAENLELGSLADRRRPSNDELQQRAQRVYGLFPRLEERRRQVAGTLSGGEQQMLAIGRALMAAPTLLMLDEPSLGLAPQVTDAIFDALAMLKEEGVTMLLSEQNAAAALELADRGYVMDLGRVVHAGPVPDLLEDDGVRRVYFGGGARG